MITSASIDSSAIQPPRSYQPSLFVNRETELQTVAKKVRQAQERGIVEDPLMSFWGIKGIGKTWILRHLHHLYAYGAESAAVPFSAPTFALLYTFPDNPVQSLLKHVARVLAEEALTQLSSTLPPKERERLAQARDTGNVAMLVKVIQSLSRRLVPLILLDNAENVPQADWLALEEGLLEPLVSTGRVLVVVAGRRQMMRWRRFEVRRRVMEPEQVRPFDKQAVIRQIERYRYDIPIDLLFPYTAGSPQLVDTIAQQILAWMDGAEGTQLDQAWFDQHGSGLLSILRASEAQLLEEVPKDLRSVLDAVSPLRFYRLEALRFMLTRSGTRPEEHSEGYYLGILRALDQQTEFVWWDREHRAYVTSQVVRQLMCRRQLLEDRSEYAVRQDHAIAMYWSWVREYPEASENFIVELWFHLASLYLADRDRDYLWSESKKVLLFACKHLNSDRLLVIQKQLGERENDRELHDLLPEALHAELIYDLERLLNEKAD